jgi:hypothetical protein
MLHLSVRPQENAIIRNHLKNQSWGSEERHGGCVIQPHQSFEIGITAEHSMYRITINGNYFCTFNHRLPLHLVRFISISGTCTISYINIDGAGPIATPAYPPVHHPIHPTPHYPIHRAPGFPSHHAPVPPPMPAPPSAPPPYPGETLSPLSSTFY